MSNSLAGLYYEGDHYPVNDGETVLDALLRQGVDARYSCRSGLCQVCVLQCPEGEIPASAQQGLSPVQQAQNYFMACRCAPLGSMKILPVGADALSCNAEVIAKEWLRKDILQLKLAAEIDWRAGQYLTLWKDDQVGRSYSIASLPEDGYLECHIKVLEDGAFSAWASGTLTPGSNMRVQGPMGLCFYTDTSGGSQPLLLCAIGTGLAPILGVVRDALNQGHKGPVDLVLGARTSEDFYGVDVLNTMAESHENLTVHWVSQDDSQALAKGNVYHYVEAKFGGLQGYGVYLCGAENFVRKMKKQCFLQGAGMSNIHADSFISGR